MKKLNIIYILTLFLLSTKLIEAQEDYKNKWQVGLTFGELPILSGSFKPGFTVGYHFNEYLMAEFTYQFNDYLQRDEESFNAVNIGFEGVKSSKEVTGERMFLGARIRPADWSPYLTAGVVLNMDDIETIKYDSRERMIGNNIYDGELTIVQKRETGVAPAVGFGYQYDFSNGVSVNTSFAMAFFNKIPTPSTQINSASEINEADLNHLKNKIDEEYKGNFHNRYHIFNLGVSYKFD
jgi:opacity protein-like surface antigen